MLNEAGVSKVGYAAGLRGRELAFHPDNVDGDFVREAIHHVLHFDLSGRRGLLALRVGLRT